MTTQKKKTKSTVKSVPQISLQEERETVIVLDYFTRTAKLYTNNSTVMNRLASKKVEFESEEYYQGKVYSRTYVRDFDKMNVLLQLTVLK